MTLTPPRAPFSVNTRVAVLSKNGSVKQGLIIALDLGLVVRIAGPGLDVVKDVVFSQTAITNDVDTFNETLGLGLLGLNLSGSGKDRDKTSE